MLLLGILVCGRIENVPLKGYGNDRKLPHSNLRSSLMNAMGLPDATFGQTDGCKGTLRDLTA